MEGIWEMNYRQKGRTGQGLYKSLLWMRDNVLTATINILDAGQCWLGSVTVLKNILRGKLSKTTSSVVFAFLTIMLCEHGSTMKWTVQGCREFWGTFMRGHTIMAQGKLKRGYHLIWWHTHHHTLPLFNSFGPQWTALFSWWRVMGNLSEGSYYHDSR